MQLINRHSKSKRVVAAVLAMVFYLTSVTPAALAKSTEDTIRDIVVGRKTGPKHNAYMDFVLDGAISINDLVYFAGKGKEEEVSPGQAKKIAHEGAELLMGMGAVAKKTDLSITPLNESNMMPLNPGMINVTKGHKGFRFLPHGMKFERSIRVRLPYDKKLIPEGISEDAVRTYYFDEATGVWKDLQFVNVDQAGQQIESYTDHFTDMINAVVTVPDSPEMQSFNPTQIQGINVANPGAGINLIEPPQANNMGSATLSYPIELPPGRLGMQPQLAIQYNSDGGNGWLGLGWDLPLQAISIDTRWGVPRYDPINETETYLLNGEQLTPVAHRGELRPRTADENDETVFRSRIEGAFNLIIRYGTSPKEYWWEVKDKNGTAFYYGGDPDEHAQVEDAILTDCEGNVFRWALHEVRDTNGNNIRYAYAKIADKGVGDGEVLPGDPCSSIGYELYLKTIHYTGHNGEDGLYEVEFFRDRELPNFQRRSDVTIDARGGFKKVTADLLREIVITFNDQPDSQTVRSYELQYQSAEQNPFYKTLLEYIIQKDENGTEFNRHRFEYHDDARNGSDYRGFTDLTSWTLPGKGDMLSPIDPIDLLGYGDASAISGSQSIGAGGHLYVGFNPWVPLKQGSYGGKGGYSYSNSEGKLALIDINGDGLQDKLFEQGDTFYYRANQSGPDAELTFGDKLTINSLPAISEEETHMFSGGAEAHPAHTVFVGANASTTTSSSAVYFNDVNGDGLPDLVRSGPVLFNRIDQNGRPYFTDNSGGTPYPISVGTVDPDLLIQANNAFYEEQIDRFPLLDTVKRWVAPWNGSVSITGDVALLEDTSDERAAYPTADGVRVVVQHNDDCEEDGNGNYDCELWDAEIAADDYTPKTPVGLDSLTVAKGDVVYFRVQSVFDGSYDQVGWNPEISYNNVTAMRDVNNLEVYRYNAAEDFILAGPGGIAVGMPFDGTVQIAGELEKLGQTTDDVTVKILQSNEDETLMVYEQLIPWNETGTVTFEQDVAVAKEDRITLKLESDSPIDLTQFHWNPSKLYYTQTDAVDPLFDQDGNPMVEVELLPCYDLYPASDRSTPLTPWKVPANGIYTVVPHVQSSPFMSSSSREIMLTVKKRGELVAKQKITITPLPVPLPFPLPPIVDAPSFTIEATQDDELFFEFSTRDPALEAQLNMHAVTVELKALKPPTSWEIPVSTSYRFTPQVSMPLPPDTSLNGKITLSVKKQNELIGETTIEVEEGVASSSPLVIEVDQDDNLLFEFSTEESGLEAILLNQKVGVLWELMAMPVMYPAPSEFHSAIPNTVISDPYRGWNVFGYNGNRERGTSPIVITPEDLTLEGRFDETSSEEYEQRIKDGTFDEQETQLNLYPFYPRITMSRLQSPDEDAWATANVLSSSREGPNYISDSGTGGGAGAQAQGVIKKSRTTQYAVAGQAGPASGSFSTSTSYGFQDFLDMNGDQFPDVVSDNGIQFTTMTGGLEDEDAPRGTLPEENARQTEAIAISGGLGMSGGNYAHSSANSKGQVSATATNSGGKTSKQMPDLGLSVDASGGLSNIDYDLMDINGDGLPDWIKKDGSALKVRFNLGYRFAEEETWGSSQINDGRNISLSLGGSIGFNDGNYGYAGGLNAGRNHSWSTKSLLDINGDGLLDRVRCEPGFDDIDIDDIYGIDDVIDGFIEQIKDIATPWTCKGDKLHVALNTGNGFTDETDWPTAVNNGMVLNTDSSIGGGGYFTIPIGPLCIVACYVIINPGADVTFGVDRIETMITDINGDGYPDELSSDADQRLDVGFNQIGRTNLLKQVTRPLGATITLDYKRNGNTYEQPHSHWDLTRVEVNDGHTGDGVDTLLVTYQYKDGFYNRQEREFYGYQTVIEEQRDSTDDSIYRTVTRTFHNNSYYNKGLLASEVLTDADGNKYTETENTYLLRDLDTGAELGNPNYLTATVFPELRRVDKRFYEGGSTAQKRTYETYSYDDVGNVDTFFDAAEVGTAADNVEARIGYYEDQDNYIIGKANSIVVRGNGVIMRTREAIFEPGTGNLLQVRQYLADGQAAITDLTYDQYGNIQTVTGPANDKGERYQLSYVYDPTVFTHNSSVTDSFGYVSTAEYKEYLKYGMPTRITDLNDNSITYTYDTVGRVSTITGPYQQGSGYPTIRFEYHPEAVVPWALTRHLDVYRDLNDPIETVLFVDGLGREIQTKKDGTLHQGDNAHPKDMVIVSGATNFDFVGRAVEQYYPVTEPLGQQENINSQVDPIRPTVTTYDVLDRPLSITSPDLKTTTMFYGFDEDRNGQVQFLTRVTDANGNAKETYRNVSERITAIKEFNRGGSEIIWTSYDYDPLNQIIAVFDDHSNLTYVQYDNFGRRTQINSPDAGLTEMTYDLASNLIRRITSNLRNQGKAITYEYDYLRLNTIIYPNVTGNNVAYTYGEPGASFNRANRIVLVTDQSGSEERFYGPLGEMVKTIKTVASKTQSNSANSPEVYVTEYVFDTWNRLQQMTYPDGEVLTNRYDSGGLLYNIIGQKGPWTYEYLNRLEYDKFSQRVFMEQGNGVRTTYAYNPENQRLIRLQAGGGTKSAPQQARSLFQDMEYGYDDVGNIRRLSNHAAVTRANQMGGATQYVYQYDDLYRLIHAQGTYNYMPDKQRLFTLDMTYDTIHNILAKDQQDWAIQSSDNWIPQHKTTYTWMYQYNSNGHPHAPVHIGDRAFTYDANGNQTGWDHDRNGTRRTIVWDEENRIQSISDGGHTMTYAYNDAGERVIKRGPQGETVYVNQFFSIRNRAIGTKHIYAGNTRLVSKLVKSSSAGSGGSGNGGGTGSHLPPGADRGQGKKIGITGELPPGADRGQGKKIGITGELPPGADKGRGKKIGITGELPPGADRGQGKKIGITGELPPGADRGQGKKIGITGELPPGADQGQGNKFGIFKDKNQPGGPPQQGPYEKDLYFYHPDHLGSTAYVTDADGELYQHLEYFPFGETWVEESSNIQRTPYLFTAKELDEETQLYYFGARYYDPRTSVWQSPDPIVEKYLPSDGQEGNLPGMGGVFNPVNLNLYQYAGQNPVKYIDPDGRSLGDFFRNLFRTAPTFRQQANCYAYAMGYPEAESNATPWAAAGRVITAGVGPLDWYKRQLIMGVNADIRETVGGSRRRYDLRNDISNIPQNDDSTHVIALFASKRGFHFLKKVENGKWQWKLGGLSTEIKTQVWYAPESPKWWKRWDRAGLRDVTDDVLQKIVSGDSRYTAPGTDNMDFVKFFRVPNRPIKVKAPPRTANSRQ